MDDYTIQGDYLDEDDKLIVAQISQALNAAEYELGLSMLRTRLSADQPKDPKALAELQFLLGGFLIDFGNGIQDRDLVIEGVGLLERHEEAISSLLGKYSVDYCLGNAKYSLHFIDRASSSSAFNPENTRLLVDAKNHHWRALKEIRAAGEKEAPVIWVNLGNALDSAGRVVEAIRCYERALEISPSFGQAHLCRGGALRTLNLMSGTYSISQVQQQERHFDAALRDPALPEASKRLAEQRLEGVRQFLQDLDVDENEEIHETHISEEIVAMSPFRRFCIRRHLALNEHSLYCSCKAAHSDSLTIPKSTGPIAGDFVPGMTLLLNRVRAEFAQARMFLYQYRRLHWDLREFEPEYTELLDNEEISLDVELLRTCFRLCFGILDRIAFGICSLFDLADAGEAIYFESFWKKPRGRSQRQKFRWERINDVNNVPLVALYSLATDLNMRNGEWGNYKRWRNHLEHEILLLTTTDHADLGPWVDRKFAAKTEIISLNSFEDETLHMLQMTASAIFYFIYCVRVEGIKVASKSDGLALRTALDKRQRE